MEEKQDANPESFIEIEKFRLGYLFETGLDFKNRSLQLTGVVGEDFDFNLVDSAFSELERFSTKKPITIKINSVGGFLTSTFAIMGRMRASPCKIHIEVYGEACSGAALILSHGDVRKMSKYSWFMFHQQHYSTGHKNHIEQVRYVAQAEIELKNMCRYMEETTKKPFSFWYEAAKKDTYFSPEECLEFGIIDKII